MVRSDHEATSIDMRAALMAADTAVVIKRSCGIG